MKLATRPRLIALALAALVTTCGGPMRHADKEVDEAYQRASQRMGEAGTVTDERRPGSSTVHEGLWIAKSSVRLASAQTLPPVFASKVSFNRRVRSLSDFAGRITVLAGIPVRVTPDALHIESRGGLDVRSSNTAGGRTGATMPPPASLQAPLPAPGNGFGSHAGGPANGAVQLLYQDGDLKGLLDLAATRFGVSWKYVDGSIEFHHQDTRNFQVRALPGESALSANVGGTGSSDAALPAANAGGGPGNGSVGSGNGQSAAVRTQLSVFASLEKAVGAMLSPYGSVVSSPATGTLTVSDTPAILDRVERFIERENRTLSRQVLINVTVLSVSLSDEDSYGLNWNVILTELSRRYGVTNTFGAAAQNSASFSANVLNTADSKFAGSSMMIKALSAQGKVRKETSASVAALNHQPVPVQVARQTAYLKSSQTTVSANVGSTTSLTPGTVTSGFTMTLLPSVLDNGTVILQFSTDISTLRRLSTVSSNGSGGGSQIQTPEVDTRNFLQRVAMKSGQTLVVSGFEQMEGGAERQGVGTPSMFALGGGLSARSNKEVIVILVTPITMPGA
jgi:type IVB pilus formation R64 PilN family outer membrane protein